MLEIVPSIVAYNLEELSQKVGVLEKFSPWAHLDVADGRFAKTLTWNEPRDLETMEGKIKLEVHLMTVEPERVLAGWRPVADRVIIHLEAAANLDEIIESFDNHPLKFGLALNLGTPVVELEPYLPRLNFVHLMSIEKIGDYGELFNELTLEKIKTLRIQKPELIISVDGGVNQKNISRVVAAGANHLVIGSAIWDTPDPEKAFYNLARYVD